MRTILAAVVGLVCGQQLARAEAPTANYIFPAGAQRGTTVAARIGGCNLHNAPRLVWNGAGVTAPAVLAPTETVWFEGPVIPQPASQQKEDYPRDFAAPLAIAADATRGRHTWRLATSQGITTPWGFVVGVLPEVVEQEFEGEAPPVRVELPVTINGRIFPREDVDTWTFTAKAGQTVTCRVATSEFGSPLDARIELRGPSGLDVAEQLPEGDRTPDLRFTANEEGEYRLRIHDVGFGGLQDHVYRLTITAGPVLDRAYPLGGRRGTAIPVELAGANLPATARTVELPKAGTGYVLRLPDDQPSIGEVRLELDDFPELLEAEPNDAMPQTCSVPTILNGRIQSPGDVDTWSFTANKGIEYDFDVRAVRLGSPLDAVLEIADAAGKRLAEADDSPGIQTDARLRWTAPADGEFRISLRDRLPSRGDLRFAYRLRVTSAEQPEFTLAATTDTLVLERGKSANLKVTVDRGPGFKQPVEISLEGLPAGVALGSPAAPVVIAPNQRDVQLSLKADEAARVAVAGIRIIGRVSHEGREWAVDATVLPANPEPGRVAVPDASLQAWVSVAVPTPFKFVGVFETKFIARGAVYVRQYHVDRNGFEGPLTVQLADRQGRHLQGVHAPPVIVPAGSSDFEFAVTLPPWMEIGRTCRSTLAVSGIVTDPDGTTHAVSYSSNDQHNQMIALVDPGRFAIQLSRATLQAVPGQRVNLPVRVQRGPGLEKPVSVELIASSAVQGVKASPVEIPGDANESSLALEFAGTLAGIEVRPLTIRATTRDERGLPVTAEARLELVP